MSPQVITTGASTVRPGRLAAAQGLHRSGDLPDRAGVEHRQCCNPDARLLRAPAIARALILAVAIAATCAFMLPVAAPPNALAFGTGMVRQDQMLCAGLILNLSTVPVVWIMVSLLA